MVTDKQFNQLMLWYWTEEEDWMVITEDKLREIANAVAKMVRAEVCRWTSNGIEYVSSCESPEDEGWYDRPPRFCLWCGRKIEVV